MSFGLGFNFGLGDAPMQAGGGAPEPEIPDSLVTNAALILDFARGSTIAYTTATGTTPTADTGFVRSVACEKAPAGAGTRIFHDANVFTFRDNETDHIQGAPVVRSGDTNLLAGATGNVTPGDFVSTTKWWLCWHGRLAGTSSNITFNLYRSDNGNGRITLFYQPSTGTLRLAIHNGTSNTNRDYVVTNGQICRFAAYFDGTNLHVWVNDVARQDYAGTGVVGAVDGFPHFFRGKTDATLDLSALWIGKLDGDDATQHMADIQSWMDVKGAA